MKKTLLIVLACVGILASSCKKDSPASIDVKTLTGVWGVSDSKQVLAEDSYVGYFRFYEDKTIETFSMYETGCLYNIGLFNIADNLVSYKYNQVREYAYQTGFTRYVMHINNEERKYGFNVLEVSKDLILYSNSNGKFYLHRVKDIPGSWDAELSAPSVEATPESLIGQWDFINIYRVESYGKTTFLSVNDPASNGMILHRKNGMDKCQFWINYLYYKLIADKQIDAAQDINVTYADCQWSVDKSLTLSCSRYRVGKIDSQGQFVAEQEMTPEEPVKVEFAIHALTDYYLILSAYDYQLGTTGYYAFHHGSVTKTNMPEQQEVGSTADRCSSTVNTDKLILK